MKLSDWYLGTYGIVVCTSEWLCGFLLCFGVFVFDIRIDFFFPADGAMTVIYCFLIFDHEIALIWCCTYFCAIIYCLDFPSAVILFIILYTSI